MSFHGFGKTTRLPLEAQPRLILPWLIIHLALAFAIWATALPVWAPILLQLCNALALSYHLRLWVFPCLVLSGDELSITEAGRLTVDAEGDVSGRELELIRVAFLSRHAAVLKLRWPNASFPFWLVLYPCKTRSEAFRRFRVRLRHGGIERISPVRGLGPSWPVFRD